MFLTRLEERLPALAGNFSASAENGGATGRDVGGVIRLAWNAGSVATAVGYIKQKQGTPQEW
jgi:hypothetical protein